MSVLVAVTDSAEGRHALGAAAAEAARLGTGLVVVNLTLSALDVAALPPDLDVEVVERHPRRSPAESVQDVVERRAGAVERIVVGVRRRTPVGKAVLGSLAQELIMDSDVPVVTVKAPRGARGGGPAEVDAGQVAPAPPG